MGIAHTAELVIDAHCEGMECAAAIVERFAQASQRAAEAVHQRMMTEDVAYLCDEYERLECEAAWLNSLAAKIRRAAKQTKRSAERAVKAAVEEGYG